MTKPEYDSNKGAEITPLPMKKVFSIALRGIKIRIGRALLVVSGIVLSIAFLTYILCSDGFMRHILSSASAEVIAHLRSIGKLGEGSIHNQRIQTYWMVGLALMISFVGIVNAMLMSVTERFREIGTMKCLGALDQFVLKLFLVESMLKGTFGTIIGMIVGLILAYGEGFMSYGSQVWTLIPFSEFIFICLICFFGGIILTVLGALYPAYQAAKMTPVVALRSEL